MKSVLLLIVTSSLFYLAAETPKEYRARRAFEAGQEVADRQVNAIRECAVSRINTCVYPIIEHLKKDGPENAQLRRESASALGELRAPEAREPLLALLEKEKDNHVKGAIIRALGKIGNKADIKVVSGYLGDSDASVRRLAARSLYDLDDKAASAEVSGKISGEKDDFTRVEFLNTALQHEGGNVQHALALSKILLSPDRAARMRAAEVLGFYKNKETLGDLRRALSVETDLQVRAVIHEAIQSTIIGY
jgi:HEAT repeat protein